MFLYGRLLYFDKLGQAVLAKRLVNFGLYVADAHAAFVSSKAHKYIHTCTADAVQNTCIYIQLTGGMSCTKGQQAAFYMVRILRVQMTLDCKSSTLLICVYKCVIGFFHFSPFVSVSFEHPQ